MSLSSHFLSPVQLSRGAALSEQLWWAPGVQPGSTHHNYKSYKSVVKRKEKKIEINSRPGISLPEQWGVWGGEKASGAVSALVLQRPHQSPFLVGREKTCYSRG